MQHILFTSDAAHSNLKTALLIKTAALKKTDLWVYYINPLVSQGVSADTLVAFDLAYNDANKCPAKLQEKCLNNLLKGLDSLGIETLIVADGPYFKKLTKVSKAEPHHGYVVPCKYPGYEDKFQVILAPNYQGLFYNPTIQEKLDMAVNTAASYLGGQYQALGQGIIHTARYPQSLAEIRSELEKLHEHPALTCDVETFSLKFWETGIATITFCWNQHEGIAFAIDAVLDEDGYPMPYTDTPVRELLRGFLESYQGTLVYHNANFDMKILVNSLWMNDLLDEPGKQKGIKVLTRNFHDTKIITYLATNSTAGNKLSLKDQAHQFAGNYAQSDIEDIRQIHIRDLLEYNLVDGLSTWFVFDKHWQTMVDDQQLEVYNTIFKPSVKLILQMELTGMPVKMSAVKEARVELETEIQRCRDWFAQLGYISKLEQELTARAHTKDYKDRKGKAKNPDKIQPKDWDSFCEKSWVAFNPNSTPQLQVLLYELLELPVIDTTDTGQPATGGDTLAKLKHHTSDPEIQELLVTLKDFFDADKILGTFVKALEGAVLKADGWYYLHGNFNLGGTVSGRLSSSSPNLQNIPSTGSKYAKLIKKCFAAPPGWLWAGADFASLEDRISALTTKDPNKLKVYVEGYDGHCLRAFYYFSEQMPDIHQAEQGEQCFRVTSNDQVFYLKSGDFVNYQGRRTPVEELLNASTRLPLHRVS